MPVASTALRNARAKLSFIESFLIMLIPPSTLTPRQQNTVWEIIEAYRAFNKANAIDEAH
jgi:hypothetical protein